MEYTKQSIKILQKYIPSIKEIKLREKYEHKIRKLGKKYYLDEITKNILFTIGDYHFKSKSKSKLTKYKIIKELTNNTSRKPDSAQPIKDRISLLLKDKNVLINDDIKGLILGEDSLWFVNSLRTFHSLK